MYLVFSVEMRKENERYKNATPKHSQTEWILCSDDWQDIVIIYIPQLNETPIEENYVAYL